MTKYAFDFEGVSVWVGPNLELYEGVHTSKHASQCFNKKFGKIRHWCAWYLVTKIIIFALFEQQRVKEKEGRRREEEWQECR